MEEPKLNDRIDLNKLRWLVFSEEPPVGKLMAAFVRKADAKAYAREFVYDFAIVRADS